MNDDEYEHLFGAPAAGILEDRYVEHSFGRGQTLLRAPGVPRHFDREVAA